MVSRPYQKIESRGWRGSYDLINNRDSAPLDLRASRLADDLTLREEREKKSTAGKVHEVDVKRGKSGGLNQSYSRLGSFPKQDGRKTRDLSPQKGRVGQRKKEPRQYITPSAVRRGRPAKIAITPAESNEIKLHYLACHGAINHTPFSRPSLRRAPSTPVPRRRSPVGPNSALSYTSFDCRITIAFFSEIPPGFSATIIPGYGTDILDVCPILFHLLSKNGARKHHEECDDGMRSTAYRYSGSSGGLRTRFSWDAVEVSTELWSSRQRRRQKVDERVRVAEECFLTGWRRAEEAERRMEIEPHAETRESQFDVNRSIIIRINRLPAVRRRLSKACRIQFTICIVVFYSPSSRRLQLLQRAASIYGHLPSTRSCDYHVLLTTKLKSSKGGVEIDIHI
ncbi:hypothetical protein ALC62_13831 [Cyphomyrmex costatus]|uniref:Uncharacterized protein n=1 Tax=Cyphomyrmex costatus TaxID=456900 RepID=A0A195C5F4_9HYME|nr:hypothetical protein ALC62_13831 [Cyphomyrmex costatus]